MEIRLKALNDISNLRNEEGWLYASLDRFQCFFGRDSIISSLELLKIYPEIAKATLLHIKKTQGTRTNIKREEEKGKVVHEERIIKDDTYYSLIKQGFEFPYYGTVDATILYLLLAEKYLEATGDVDTIKDIGDSLSLALEWVSTKFDDIGIVRIPSMNITGEVAYSMINKNWLDSPLSLSYKDGTLAASDLSNYPVAFLEVQASFIGAMRFNGIIYPYLNNNAKALIHDLVHKADNLSRLIDKYFSIDDDKYYAPAIDAANRRFEIITSIPGYMLYTGAATIRQAEIIKSRLMKNDMLTSFGVRTMSVYEKRFDQNSYQQGAVWPIDNWMIYEGLKRYGYMEEAQIIKRNLFKAVKKLGYIPEFFNVSLSNKLHPHSKAMKVQAWSAGAILAMSSVKKRSRINRNAHVLAYGIKNTVKVITNIKKK